MHSVLAVAYMDCATLTYLRLSEQMALEVSYTAYFSMTLCVAKVHIVIRIITICTLTV